MKWDPFSGIRCGLQLIAGSPSATRSWFPPYEWQCAFCPVCRTHLGWAFSAAATQREALDSDEACIGVDDSSTHSIVNDKDDAASAGCTTAGGAECAGAEGSGEEGGGAECGGEEGAGEEGAGTECDIIFLGLVLTQLAERRKAPLRG